LVGRLENIVRKFFLLGVECCCGDFRALLEHVEGLFGLALSLVSEGCTDLVRGEAGGEGGLLIEGLSEDGDIKCEENGAFEE
jgi:hypothetical protein